MNLNDYKYIITTGCSYSVMAKSLVDVSNFSIYQHYQQHNSFRSKFVSPYSDVIVIDVGLSSHGSNWQADSIIYTIDKLLSLGIQSENLYCFIEWSEWGRVAFNNDYIIKPNWDDIKFLKYTGQYGNMGLFHLNVETHTTVYNSFNDIHNNQDGEEIRNPNRYSEVAWFIEDAIQIRHNPDLPQLARIGDVVYISPNHVGNTIGKGHPEFDMWFDEATRKEKELSQDYRIKNYLDNILKTQWFLESKNVKYNCTTIYSQFSKWDNAELGLKKIRHLKEFVKGDLFDPSTFEIQKENFFSDGPQADMSVHWPAYKHLIDKIDFSNWWIYNSDLFRKGGIDEYAIEQWGGGIYTSMNQIPSPDPERIMKISVNVQLPQFGHHPIMPVYLLLWNEISSNCDFLKINDEYEDWLRSAMKEDMECDELTKHGIMISTKYLPALYSDKLKINDNIILTINI